MNSFTRFTQISFVAGGGFGSLTGIYIGYNNTIDKKISSKIANATFGFISGIPIGTVLTFTSPVWIPYLVYSELTDNHKFEPNDKNDKL